MEDALLDPVSEVIRESRHRCELGDIAGALKLIHDATNESPPADRLRIEVVRIYLIFGDQASAGTELSGFEASASSSLDSAPYYDVLALQQAYIRVFARGDLAVAVKTADTLWNKYELDTAGKVENGDGVIALVAYYALEIYDLHRRYGQGLAGPLFEPRSNLLQTIITRLISIDLTVEAFEIIEYFTNNALEICSGVVWSHLMEKGLSLESGLIRLAKLHFENDDVESANAMLSNLDDLELQGPLSNDKREVLTIRFLDTEMDKAHRIDRLMQLSSGFQERGDFLTAMDALEHAASLHCQLGVSNETSRLGVTIHDALRLLCSRTDDQLSGIQFEFRRCDMISSTTTDLAAARTRRDELLSLPICDNLPHFGKIHRRQCIEYLMVNQRDSALHHAEKYTDYCRLVGDEDEISMAENLRLTALVHPTRTSDEARESLLEDVRQSLEEGIASDEAAARYIAYAEKSLLLAQVMEEIASLQGEEREDSWTDIAEILCKAERVCKAIATKPDGALLALEISYLREVFSSESFTSLVAPSIPTSNSEVEGGDTPRIVDLRRFVTRHSFSETKFIFDMVLVIRSEEPAMFFTLNCSLKREEERLAQEGHSMERSRFLLCQAIFYYVMTQLMDEPFFSPTQFGFSTRVEGLEKSLRALEESLCLEVAVEDQVHDQSPEDLIGLAALQAHHTAHLRLHLFEIAISICFEMDDIARLWEWVQRSKARAYTTWLQKSLGKGQIKYPHFHGDLTFKEMAWVSSATSRTIFFIDFVVVHRDLMPPVLLLLALHFIHEDDGPIQKLTVIETNTSIEALEDQAHSLNPARLDSNDWPRALRGFNSVVEPLAEICREGDLLVLSPTSPLHNIPLHIIGVEGKPLLERNPVVYVPSLGVLATCLHRLEAPSPDAECREKWKAAMLGAYEDSSTYAEIERERRQIYSSLQSLGVRLDCASLVGTGLDVESFSYHAKAANLVHFHGHASLSEHAVSKQSLLLGPPNCVFGLSDAMSLNFEVAPHVNLIACSGGVQDFSLGNDEPLGLLSAFLAGGAASVVGALWPVQSATGRRFTDLFFKEFLAKVHRSELGPIVNLAEAVRRACLKIRNAGPTGEETTPYHWAAFVLHGAWFCGRKPGSW